MNVPTIPQLIGLRVVLSPYVDDQHMVFKRRKEKNKYGVIADYYITIWDLDTNELRGDLDPHTATEVHMSRIRYNILQEQIDEFNQRVRQS